MADGNPPTDEGKHPSEGSTPEQEATFRRREARTETASQDSVLKILETRTGISAKVMLSEEPSAHGAPPVVSMSAEDSQQVPPGRGSYQLHGEIARGGMGAILKGHDTDLGRDVAIKVLLKKHADNPAILQRFVEEAQIGGQLQHPGIVPVYEMGLMSDDRPYFTMKLVKGRTLAALLSERKDASQDRRRFLSIFEQICQTMAYAHSRKVVHRDLKPANIMVGAFGEVQLVDWGLAKVIREGGVTDELVAQQAEVSIIETVRSGPGSTGSDSLAGSVMGTPAYMSPEQAQGEIDRLDQRTDVFALGAVLCQILTGAPPYVDKGGQGESVLVQAAKARLDDAHRRLKACAADDELVEIATDCLTPNRGVRPRSAEVLATRVGEYLAAVEERARDAQIAAAKARLKSRLTLLLAGTVLLALLGAGGGYYWFEEQARTRVAHVRAQVDEVIEAALPFEAAGAWSEARATAAKAELVAESPDADDELRAYVARFVDRLHDGEARDLTARAAAEKNARFLAVLEPLQVRENVDREADLVDSLIAQFAEAFRGYGIDLETLTDDEAVAAIVDSGIAVEIAQALDEWARLEMRTGGYRSATRARLLDLAMQADSDPWRTRVRQVVLEDDLLSMRALAESDEAAALPPESIWSFGLSLWNMGHRGAVLELMKKAQRRYPDDFFINLFLGSALRFATQPPRPAEAVRYYMAAHALRPTSSMALRRLSTALLDSGDYEAAEYYSELFLLGSPDDWQLMNTLSWSLATRPSGEGQDPARAVTLARRAIELAPQDQLFDVLNTWGGALCATGDWQQAIRVVERAVQARSSYVVNWVVLAWAHALGGHAEQASAYLDQARIGMRGVDDASAGRIMDWTQELLDEL